ncbi:OsmC family protein [Pontibacter silvestris]|uniref:OsmC family protein n=1 Tax=Pontibacter silvestris TaxID=2305183 RepID=A0ABW4WTK8_9BACT|nr:OsmC family protein [Pontibacter silvestris]MCC9137968.1 OsmC family protein [Pontibacter silvestris]
MESNEILSYVTASADSTAGMVANIQIGDQKIVIDESGMAEGLKLSPDPYDYIMCALGACTVITLHMYAQRKHWPLERAEVRLNHERVYMQDCLTCEDDNKSKVSHITKKLKLVGDLSSEQRKRLEIISSRCPVQRTLSGGINILTLMD